MSGLTPDQVLELHEDLIDEHGGLHGVLDQGKLDSALAQPISVVFGVERYPTPAEQAAAYLYYVVEAHAFVDGNKRTAIACCLIWLRLQGVQHQMSEDRLFELTVLVADSGMQIGEIAQTIKEYLI